MTVKKICLLTAFGGCGQTTDAANVKAMSLSVDVSVVDDAEERQ